MVAFDAVSRAVFLMNIWHCNINMSTFVQATTEYRFGRQSVSIRMQFSSQTPSRPQVTSYAIKLIDSNRVHGPQRARELFALIFVRTEPNICCVIVRALVMLHESDVTTAATSATQNNETKAINVHASLDRVDSCALES